MPAILEKAVQKIKAKGGVDNPWAVAVSALQKGGDLVKGTKTATKKGIMRGKKSEAWRHAHPAADGGRIDGAGMKPNLGRPGRR